MLSLCLATLLFIVILFDSFIKSVVLSFGKKEGRRTVGQKFFFFFYECHKWVWKEPVIGDKSLSCGAVTATERHLDVCVTRLPCALLTTRTVRPLPHSGLYFRKKEKNKTKKQQTKQKTSAINPSICASMTFHRRACESVCFRDMTEYLYQWTEINRDVTGQTEGAKTFLELKRQDKSR